MSASLNLSSPYPPPRRCAIASSSSTQKERGMKGSRPKTDQGDSRRKLAIAHRARASREADRFVDLASPTRFPPSRPSPSPERVRCHSRGRPRMIRSISVCSVSLPVVACEKPARGDESSRREMRARSGATKKCLRTTPPSEWAGGRERTPSLAAAPRSSSLGRCQREMGGNFPA